MRHVSFEDLSAIRMKNIISWDAMSCSLVGVEVEEMNDYRIKLRHIPEKAKSCFCASLIKHYTMKACRGVDV
jgi:hypothetical protein